jgi:hypothetical protein
MKKILLIMFIMGIAATACRDEDTIRIPDFKNAPNLRIQFITEYSFFNFEDLANAKLVYGVYSQNYNEIESVELGLRYQKTGAPSCANRGCTDRIVFKTYTASQLAAKKGVLEDEEILFTEVATALGMDLDDFKGGDLFLFDNITTMKDGRVYPDSPAGSSNVPVLFGQPGASFTSAFNIVIGCPLQAAFTGTYTVDQIEGDVNWNPTTVHPGGPTSTIFKEMDVTLVAANPVSRTFNITYIGFENRVFVFNLICDEIQIPLTGLGVSCGGPQLSIVTDPLNPDPLNPYVLATYDPADDSEIIITFTENALNACGGGAVYTQLKLTKKE